MNSTPTPTNDFNATSDKFQPSYYEKNITMSSIISTLADVVQFTEDSIFSKFATGINIPLTFELKKIIKTGREILNNYDALEPFEELKPLSIKFSLDIKPLIYWSSELEDIEKEMRLSNPIVQIYKNGLYIDLQCSSDCNIQCQLFIDYLDIDTFLV